MYTIVVSSINGDMLGDSGDLEYDVKDIMREWNI